MHKNDMGQVGESLNSLAEVFGKPPVTVKALQVWYETIKEFEARQVLGLLNNWAKTHGRFPAPNELWKGCNEIASISREREAQADKEAVAKAWNGAERTEYGAQKMAEIREILSRPKPSPYEHWKRVLKTPGLPDVTYRAAEDFMARRATQGQAPREPGQDDEETHERTETA